MPYLSFSDKLLFDTCIIFQNIVDIVLLTYSILVWGGVPPSERPNCGQIKQELKWLYWSRNIHLLLTLCVLCAYFLALPVRLSVGVRRGQCSRNSSFALDCTADWSLILTVNLAFCTSTRLQCLSYLRFNLQCSVVPISMFLFSFYIVRSLCIMHAGLVMNQYDYLECY